MFNFISFSPSIGLEYTPNGIKGALIKKKYTTPYAIYLFTFHSESSDVKLLYTEHPLITTGLGGKEVLVRPLVLPLIKEKDIEEVLIFQTEPLLPYAAEQAILVYQVISKTLESTDLRVLAARKEAIQAHIDEWRALQIEPEKITSTPSALCEFGATYLSTAKTYLILHLQHQEMTIILVKDNKLLASFACSEGFHVLLEAQSKENLASLPQNECEWQAIEKRENSPLAAALKRLQKEVAKMGFALIKDYKHDTIEGIAVTGEAAEWEGLSQILIQNLHFPLLTCERIENYPAKTLLYYAVPIGLALSSLPKGLHNINFRQKELSYPYPWRRLKTPLILYFASVLLLTFAFYFFGKQYLQYQENQLKQSYIDLLASMNKSHEEVESNFAVKNFKMQLANVEVPKIEQLHGEDLTLRLAFLQKDLQTKPDSFPLFANIPRVSDILAWLSQHPAAVSIDEKGNRQAKLQIENFTYLMLKRPQQGKKQEKYQVKVELEFSSQTPKWAREFHDALITPNDWIDTKGEVKWSSNRGKYKTSFFLKDKTTYPSL